MKGVDVMSNTDKEIFELIHASEDPEKVAAFFISLCLDYLHTHGPLQERPSSVPQESA